MANENEEQLLAITQPASILNNLNTLNHHGAHLNEDIQASITVFLLKMHSPNRPIREVRDACIYFMTHTNNLPGPLQHGGIISDEIVKNLHQVVFGGASVIRTILFKDDDWPIDKSFTLALEDDLSHETNFDNKFIRSCRKLTVALSALNIRGNRFIRADRLIDTFYPGSRIGRRRKEDDRRKMFSNLHKVTADELWSGIGIVVKKYVSDNYNGGKILIHSRIVIFKFELFK